MSVFSRGFRTFPRPQKSARVAAHSSAELGAHSGSFTLNAHQVAPGASESHGEPIVWYDEELGAASRTVWAALFWRLLTTDHSQWGATVGTLTVEVPQIQFFDDEVVDQFQFFEKVFDGTGVVQRQLSMLDGVQYIDKLWMCPWSCR